MFNYILKVLPKIKGFLQVITASDMMTKLRSDSDQLTFSLELSAPGTPSIMESPVPEFNSRYFVNLSLCTSNRNSQCVS